MSWCLSFPQGKLTCGENCSFESKRTPLPGCLSVSISWDYVVPMMQFGGAVLCLLLLSIWNSCSLLVFEVGFPALLCTLLCHHCTIHLWSLELLHSKASVNVPVWVSGSPPQSKDNRPTELMLWVCFSPFSEPQFCQEKFLSSAT